MPLLYAAPCSPQKQNFVIKPFTASEHRKARHQYSKSGKNQIRLSSFQPGATQDCIVCTLHVVNLLAYDNIGGESLIEGFDHYEAILYVWGGPEHTDEIDCNAP